jgi:uroporphyrinogen decarboxylase
MPAPRTATLFERACRGERTARVPVWLMRQAGRYLPEYQALKERYSFWDLCVRPELAAQATLDAARILDTDAAIIFSDITLPGHAMGLPLEFAPGPRFARAVRQRRDLDDLRSVEPTRDLGYVMEAIRRTREALPPEVSLIGFCGAPFTLAAYMVEGTPSKTWVECKRMVYGEPELFGALLERVVDVVAAHARAQIEAGCDAVQLFDSHAGELSAEALRAVAFASAKQVVERLRPLDVPVIYFGRGIAAHLEAARDVGAHVLGVDWTLTMAEARRRLGPKVALQGNLDPAVLFTTPVKVDDAVRTILQPLANEPGIIFNLGHGVLPGTPPENAMQVIKSVRKHGNR